MKKVKYEELYTLRSDGRYQGYYRDAQGKRHAVCDRSAERLHQRLQELSAGDKPLLLRDVAEQWAAAHRTEIGTGTWKNYKPHYDTVVAKYGACQLDEISAMDISSELMMLKGQGYSRTTVNSVRSIYNMIYDYAIAHGYTKYNPASSVKLPKGLPQGKRSAPTDAQMSAIVNTPHPFRLFPLLLLCTGLRKSEALALEWTDIDFSSNVIHVTKALDYKSGSIAVKAPKTEAGLRDVVMIPLIRDELAEAKLKSNSKLVFPKPANNRDTQGGGYYSLKAFDGAWDRYCRDLGLTGLTAHQLRHGTATLMFEAGTDEKTAQHVLGHSRVEITREIYTDLRIKQEMASMAKFGDVMANLMAQSQK